MVFTYVHWALWAVAFHFFISQVTCNVDSIGPDDDGQCGKYKISCPLGKICRVRKIYWPRKVQYPICVLRDTPVENRFTCTLPPAPGKCLGRFLRWYYNTHSGQCSFFYYSGCQGNDNMFMRREDCEQTCLGLGELVIPPEATVLPPVDPLMATVGPNNLELVDVSAITKKDRRGRKHRKNRKDKKRRGKKRRNRRLQRYQSLRGAKTSFVPAQKDAPNKKTETVNSRVLPTSLRKSIASGRYFRIFTILSRRHGNNVYRYNRSRSHRRRKHRNRSTTSLPPVAPPTTPIV